MPLDFRFCGRCGASMGDDEAGAPSQETAPLSKPVRDAPPSEQGEKKTTTRGSVAPLSGERRLATILIADVKDSTTLMEKLGTEAWVEVMNQVLQVLAAEVHRFGGEVDQFRGDGLIAFFGARAAHEDDPERAVFAALMMQLAIQKLSAELDSSHGIQVQVRIGINTGEVIAASIGDIAQHTEETAMGGAIALAARLEAAAEPGTVLVSQATYQLTQPRFRWQALGEVTLPGISQPVPVFRPLAPLSETTQQHHLAEYGLSIPLIGREREIQQIETAIQDLRRGVGGIILLSGAAGLGKTRLISEVEQSVRRQEALFPETLQPVTFLRGRCRSYGHSIPHSMWIDALQSWLGKQETDNQERVLERLGQKTRDLWGEGYTEYYPYLARFLSLPLEESFLDWVEHLEAEGLRHQFFFVIRSWLEALARRGPLVVVFTEMHWVDQASLALLQHCLPLCDQEALLWTLVFRPDPEAPTWQLSHSLESDYPHRLTTIELAPLSPTESARLLDHFVGPDTLPEEMREAIITRSEGNPYYLTEILRSLIERGILVHNLETNRWELTQSEVSLDLPDSLINLLSARLTRLSPLEQRVLQRASVIGTVFWSKPLEALVEEDLPLSEVLTSLQRTRLIRDRGSASPLGNEFVFTSALVRDAAYESLLSSQRVELHLTVAEFLENLAQEQSLSHFHGLIAYQYRQAGVCHKEITHTLEAAQYARRVYANDEAVQHFRRVLTLLDEQQDRLTDVPPRTLQTWRLEALAGLGQTCFGIGEVNQAEAYLRQAVSLGRELGLPARELIRLFYWLGEVLFWQNRYEEPIHLGEEGLYYLGEDNRNVEAALMNQLVAVGCSQLGDHDKFIEFTQRTAGFIQDLPYTEELRPAYDHIVGLYAYTLKDVAEAERWLAIFQQKAEAHHDIRALGEVFNHKASILNRQGAVLAAIEYYQKAIELFERIRDDKHTCRALRSLGVCYLQTGQLDAARQHITQSIEKARTFENKMDFALGYWFEAQILRCQGLQEAAETTAKKAQEMAQGIPAFQGGWAFLGLGQVHFSQTTAYEITGTFQSTLENDPDIVFRNPYLAASILSELEQAYSSPEAFRDFVDRFREQHPNLSHAPFSQWYLVPGEINRYPGDLLCQEAFHQSFSDCWEWQDPFGDCSYHVQDGLTIRAANERNFHHINRSAPRLVRAQPVLGDFALQVRCQPASADAPGIGGLLIWQNEKNWLCLEIGSRGAGEIIFRGFKDNRDMVFGRGHLASQSAWLRLEKHGYQISAFCSPDGESWFFAGNTHFHSDESVTPGVHAIGHINRLIYPGAFPEGTVIRFNDLALWGR